MIPFFFSLVLVHVLGQVESLHTQDQVAGRGETLQEASRHARTVEIPVYNNLAKQVAMQKVQFQPRF